MVQNGHGQVAGFYAAASIGLGLFAVWLGMSLAIARKGVVQRMEVMDG